MSQGPPPRYDWIGGELPHTTSVLNGFYVIEEWKAPRGGMYAFGTTLVIHPLDVAAIQGRAIARQKLWGVVQWLKSKGVEV